MGKYKIGSLIFKVSVILFLILGYFSEASGPPGVSTETSDDWGVRTTTVNTPSGKLTINMPDDAALGDTISGTVVAEPAGETVAEKQDNMDTLEGYVVDIEEIPEKTVASGPEEAPGKEPEGKKINTWVIPPIIATEITSLVLKDPKGNEVAETDFPVTSPPAYTPPEVPGPGDYNLPTIGQAGRPVEMTGPFDGELVNTEVKIGGRQTDVLAQSPRKTVAESPKDVVGPTDIELTEGDVTVKEPYRSVALKLSADKLRLTRGERTTLRVQVLGLQGLEEEIPFNLVNESPAVVSMEGGDAQTVTVHPEEIGPEGDYTITRTLTGRQTGPFSVSARISPEYMSIPGPTLISDTETDGDKCECTDLKVELGKKRDTRRFQEKLGNGNTRIMLEIPYRFKTKCSKGDPDEKCEAEVKASAEWKGDNGPVPVSEEVHDGQVNKVSYFTKPAQGADKNIDCTRDCPNRLSWSDWQSGLIYYDAQFANLAKELTEKVKIKLEAEKCEKGRKDDESYDVQSCECNMISIVFPGVSEEAQDRYSLDVDKGSIKWMKPGVQLIIPYIYTTTCTGYWRALCNASVEVKVELSDWKIESVKRRGNRTEFREEPINVANIKVSKTDTITCSGQCNRKGDQNRWNPNDIKELKIDLEVPEGRTIKKDDIERHSAELKLTFTPKFCDKYEIRDKAGKDGKVIESITFKADIKSDKWKELAGD